MSDRLDSWTLAPRKAIGRVSLFHKFIAVVALAFLIGLFIEAPGSATKTPQSAQAVQASSDSNSTGNAAAPTQATTADGKPTSTTSTAVAKSGSASTTKTTVAPAVVTGPTNSNSGSVPTSRLWGTATQWENFDGDSLNSDQWYIYDAPNNRESRTPSQVQVSNGKLNLVGKYDKANSVFTSGGVSWNLGRAKYGKWEVRMRTDAGAGFSPTILLWPDSENWPTDGEIDLFEGGPYPDRQQMSAALHNGVQNYSIGKNLKADFTQWHTFGVEWTPTSITYFLDGKPWTSIDNKKYIPTTSSMHIALQNDTGCGWVKCPNSSTKLNTTMQVDWVALYN